MNWLFLLLSQFMEDAMIVQEGKWKFRYSWLLILIALVTWMELANYQGMDVAVGQVCKDAMYQNL